jgi:hypothetical protein
MINEGACCAVCGMPYVTPTLPPGTDLEGWARSQREKIEFLRKLS